MFKFVGFFVILVWFRLVRPVGVLPWFCLSLSSSSPERSPRLISWRHDQVNPSSSGRFFFRIVFLFCFICFTGLLSCSCFSLDGRFWLCCHRPSLFFFNRLCDHTPTTDVSPLVSNVSRWDITFTDCFLRLLAAKFKSAQFFGTILRDYE